MTTSQPVLTLPEGANQALSIRAKALLFEDPKSRALLQQIERIASSDATVLIVGETGTGKELVARHLHQASGRGGPFVAVNCGAFSENLIDAELFGHESGAYTGAVGARAGWFEAAQGGTLFLDEIGDLSRPLQVKLLRVLQERQVVRLGSRKGIALDVRLVAATNIDLQQAVDANNFRADLFYRLNVAALKLAPLRERTGDILPLAEHFMRLYAKRMDMGPVLLDPEARTALLAYPWPGNIRELENVIHFGLIVCRDSVVRAHDLKLVRAVEAAPSAPAAVTPLAPELPTPDLERLGQLVTRLAQDGHPDLFHTIEDTVVRAIYLHCRENQVQSARVLGITRNTLRTLLKRYGLIAATPDDELVPEGSQLNTA